MSNTQTTDTQKTPDTGKTIAILSYITWIGWIIALVMHNGNKTTLGAFHLRQTLGLWIAGIVASIVLTIIQVILAFIPAIGLILALVLSLAFLAAFFYMWLMGLLAAVKAEEKPMPIIGEKIQTILKNVFA